MKIKLGEAFELQMGKTPLRNNPLYWNGNNKWMSIMDLGNTEKYICKTKECITESAIDETGMKVVPKGTVVMSFKLSIGKVAITSEDMYTNEAIMAFLSKGVCDIDTDYLYHLFVGTNWHVGTNKAVMGLTLNKAVLSEKEILLPNIDIQREIARKLDCLDNIILNQKRQIERLDDVVKSRFVEMFGDPITNSLGWNEECLSSILTVVGGYAFKSDKFEEIGIPVLRIGNINSGHFVPMNMVYWHDDPSLDRYKIYPGDLVMSLTGTVGKDDYGNVCILGADYDVYYLNQRNAKLELFGGVDKYYISEFLKFPEVKKRLTNINRGVRQANISNKDILDLNILVPPLELQNKFATFVQQIGRLKLAVKESLEKLEIMKKALMQQYFG